MGNLLFYYSGVKVVKILSAIIAVCCLYVAYIFWFSSEKIDELINKYGNVSIFSIDNDPIYGIGGSRFKKYCFKFIGLILLLLGVLFGIGSIYGVRE